jgi:hypothetical protein
LEEEMRAAQAKYEETLTELDRRITNASQTEVKLTESHHQINVVTLHGKGQELEYLAQLIEIEKVYYEKALDKMVKLSSILRDRLLFISLRWVQRF